MVNYLFTWIFILSCLVNWGTVEPESGTHSEQNPTVKILSYNVRNCSGLDRVTDYNRVADVIRRVNADVVAIQELDSATIRSKRMVVLSELAERTNLYATYSSSIDFQGGKYGVGVLTREKPVSWKKIALPGREEKRSLLIVELKEYVICCTHFSLTAEDRLSSIGLIEEATRNYSKPLFLAGDLNTEPGSEALIRLGKNWILLSNPQEMTFPADQPDRCIDYILVRKEHQNRVNLVETKVEAESVASDHRPVWVKLTLR